MEMKKVSVIVPTYKREKYLIRALNSIINQTYHSIEIILVDDNVNGSIEQNRTENIFKKYKQFCDIKYIATGGHVGGGRARNIGCQNATGEFLAFLDDDDIYLPEKIEKQLEYMIDKQLDFCFQDVIWLNENNEIVEHRKFNYIKDFSNQNLLKEHLLHNIAPTSIYMIKKEAFKRTRGFGDLKVGQDIFLVYECINSGLKIGYMHGTYVNQYLHKGDRISVGRGKIDGENWWYKEKQKYINILSHEEKIFFRFRHYMILLFACIRSAYWGEALYYAVVAFCISPKLCLVEGYKYICERIHNKK